MSWSLNDRNIIDLKGYIDEWGWPGAGSQWTAPSASQGEVGDNQAWAINYQSIFSDRTFMEVRYNGWKSNDDFLSATGSTEAAYIDYSPPGGGPELYWGGACIPGPMKPRSTR